MNREILFRGKRTDNGEWVEGNLFIPDYPDKPTEICLGTNIVRITYEVIPETVGQYTGLTDKNGKKIFEGDVLEFTNNDNEKSLYLIEWDGISSSYKIWTPEKYCDDCDYWNRDRFEIIGNIFDNPNLIKQEG